MKAKHGTRMVQVITANWFLLIILDEPPLGLLNRWRAERVKYYERMEPTEAPRDKTPYHPPQEKVSKTLRLEKEASDKMWVLLLGDEQLNAVETVAQKDEIHEVGAKLRENTAREAAALNDEVIRKKMEESWKEGDRVVRPNVYIDPAGAARVGTDMTKMPPPPCLGGPTTWRPATSEWP